MNDIPRLGYWSALVTFAAAAAYGVVQIGQLIGALTFPWDEIAIFGFSMLIPGPFVLSMVALDHTVSERKRIWTQAAIAFAVIYATLVTIVYPTQLAVVIPAKLAGHAADVQMLLVSKGTFMWVIDGVGYISMGLATLLAAGALADDRPNRWLRRFFIANGLLDPIIIAIYVFPSLILIGSLWLITAPGSMLLLAKHFKEKYV